MIVLKTPAELEILREGGRRLAAILAAAEKMVRPGLTTAEISRFIQSLIEQGGDRPAFLGYRPRGAKQPFPAAACVSLNEEVVHGIPSERRRVADGDLVSLDVGLEHRGLFTDAAISFVLGPVPTETSRLLQATAAALVAGIKAIRPGGELRAVSAAIEGVARREGLGIIRELGGHGVGKRIHEPPEIPNYVAGGPDLTLRSGMVLAIEPMFCLGSGRVRFLPDGYTVETADRSLAAHFEQTVAVVKEGAEILTGFGGGL